MIYIKACIGRHVLHLAGPLFAWRVRIITRAFGESARWYDPVVSRIITAADRFFARWESGPSRAIETLGGKRAE